MENDLIDSLSYDPQKLPMTIGTILKLWFDALPHPAWIKSYKKDAFRMAYTNDRYTKVTGIPPTEYFYEEDSTVWSDETARRYEINDRDVLENNKGKIYEEKVEQFHFLGPKWPVFKGDEIIAVAGLMEDLNGNRH